MTGCDDTVVHTATCFIDGRTGACDGFQGLAGSIEPARLVPLDGQVELTDGQLDNPGCKEVAAAQALPLKLELPVLHRSHADAGALGHLLEVCHRG